MKKINIIYWVSTILLVIGMGIGAVMDAMSNPEAIKMIHDQLGYPAYFSVFIGIAKLLGCIAILTPAFPKLKEWAYAGFTFDLIGATYSTIAIGTPITMCAPMLIFFAVLAVSYIYYRKRLAATNQA